MAEGCLLTYSKYLYSRTHYLLDLKEKTETSIVVWLVEKDEKSKSIVFRDPSGFRELKIYGDKGEELFKLPRETLLYIRGLYDGDILRVENYEVILKPIEEPPVSYVELDEDLVKLAKYSPWYLRNAYWSNIIKLQHYMLWYAREFLYSKGFIELLPPMISVVSDPGLRGAKKLKTIFYGKEYELTSSTIMYKQATAAVYEKIFFVARNVREEPKEHISTGRHLAEFTQLDIEWALASIDDVIRLAEELLKYVSRKLLGKHQDIVFSLNKNFTEFKPPFPRISYDDALEITRKLGYDGKWGQELSQQAETALAEYYGSPVWVLKFPAISRGFYYLPDPHDPRYNLDFNLILPKGYGEVIDGGAREYRYDKLVERIKLSGEPLEKYSWFLDLAKSGGIPPSSGWGLGVERLTRYIAGAKHIALAAIFPKLPGITGTP